METEADVWFRTKKEFNRLSNLNSPGDLDKGRKRYLLI